MFLNYYATSRILRSVSLHIHHRPLLILPPLSAATPAFGRLAAAEARLEGEYRQGVGRVGRESEQVA